MAIYEKNGKYYSRFKIHGHQKHILCHGATSKKQAQAIEDAEKFKLRQEIGGITKKEQKPVSLSLLLKRYENYSKTNKKSYQTYDVYAIRILRDYFGGNKNILELKTTEIESFKSHLLAKGLKASTINKYVQTLGKVINLGIDCGLLENNPVNKIAKLRVDNYKIRYLSIDEEKALFNEICKGQEVVGRDHKKKTIYPYRHLKPIVICALQTGMRRGEILNCRKDWVDLDKGYLNILETKNGKSREIPISKSLKPILKEAMQNDSEYVFVNPETQMPYVDIKHSFSTVIKNANISNFSFHCLRHTAATRMIESGCDIVVVKEILGHSDVSTTMRYTHSDSERKKKAITLLGNYNNYESI